MSLPFAFPPNELHEWRSLDRKGRELWLGAACDRVFEGAEQLSGEEGPSVRTARFPFSKIPGRTVELDGALFDDLLGFYCAIGEAVNGPGGYFGATMMAFDDCLFGGFGLEAPYTIVWRDSARSARLLDSAEFLSYLESESGKELQGLDPGDHAEELAALEQARADAMSGKRTMFDEIVEAIRSVPSRTMARTVEVTLLLE